MKIREWALVLGILIFAAALVAQPQTSTFPRRTPTPFDGGAVLDQPATHLPAIQRVIDQHGAIEIPSGTTWTIDGAIRINRPNVTVKGYGPSSVIRQSMAGRNTFEVTANRFRLDGVHGIGEGSASGLAAGNFVFATNCTQLVCRDNYTEGFSGCSYQMRSVSVANIQDNMCWGAKNTDPSAADVLTWGNCTHIKITGNVLVSDISQNIYVNALPGDKWITIAENVCDTLDDNFQRKMPSSKRHSIIACYGPANGAVYTTVTENICANTLWTGVYVQGSASQVLVQGNLCDQNGRGTSGSSLGGGVQVVGSTSDVLVADNIVTRFASTENGVGGITVNSSGSGIVIVDNHVSDSAGRGFVIGLGADHVIARGNVLARSAGTGILVASSAGANSSGQLIGNTVDGANNGIWLDPQGSGGFWRVFDNELRGRGVGKGMTLLTTSVQLRDNRVTGFLAP